MVCSHLSQTTWRLGKAPLPFSFIWSYCWRVSLIRHSWSFLSFWSSCCWRVFLLNHCQFSLSIIILELLFEGFFAQSSLIFFMHCLAQSLPIFFMHCIAQSLSILLIFFLCCFAQSIDIIVLVIVIVKYAFHQACFVGSFLTNVIWSACIVVVLWKRHWWNNTSNFVHQGIKWLCENKVDDPVHTFFDDAIQWF